ncbi:hypothetical protein FIBSPDRAFT_940251 [Athelia psychrophila]|uniref:Uncharacterized protein n=1 Tax=Athelia psychrophila TaxID=1759441 RepID=A0A167WC47_9AGAM|nr:hypothetical protein FIBSPDRAFT_940251 [Fibularhizoctonia sp. CBS 109695]
MSATEVARSWPRVMMLVEAAYAEIRASNGNIFTVRDDLLQDIDEGKSGVPRAFVILRRQKFQCERRVMERREGVRHEIDSPRPPKAIDALSSETHLKGSEGDGDDDDDEQNIPITPPQGADVKMLSNEIISAVIADPPSVNPESSQEKSHHDSASSAKPILADQGVRPVYSQIWEWLLTVFELLLRSCKRVTLVEPSVVGEAAIYGVVFLAAVCGSGDVLDCSCPCLRVTTSFAASSAEIILISGTWPK